MSFFFNLLLASGRAVYLYWRRTVEFFQARFLFYSAIAIVLALLALLREEHIAQADKHAPVIISFWKFGSADLTFLMHVVPDIIGGIVIAVIGERLLRSFKQNRKDSLFEIILKNVQNTFPLLQRLANFAGRNDKKENFESADYKHLLQLIYYANQRIKRSIDLNETVATDTFLNVDEIETRALVNTNDAAYELSSILEYVSERLGNRDYFALGYDDADTSKIEGMFKTLKDDLRRLHFEHWLSEYIRSYYEVFQYIDAKGQKTMRYFYMSFVDFSRSVASDDHFRFVDDRVSLQEKARRLFPASEIDT